MIDVGPVLEQYEPRLREACRKIHGDQQSFGRALFENIPKMMFIFPALIAAVLSVLYVRSGRYYVEHLLFVVHFHAFFFLAGIVVLLLERLANRRRAARGSHQRRPGGTRARCWSLTWPWYGPAQAMRRCTRRAGGRPCEGRAAGLAYFFSLVFTGLGLLAYTALTL